MKSASIGFIALYSSVMIFAQMPLPPNNQQQGVLQTDASVSLQVNISASSTIASQVSQLVAIQSVQQAYSNASIAQTNAANASFWTNNSYLQQSYLAYNVTALMVAQASVLVAQAAQSQAMQYALIYDPINILAGATNLLQIAAIPLTSTALTTALTLVTASALQLQNQFTVLAAQAAQSIVNATSIQTAANLVLNANNNITTATAASIANAQVVFATQQSNLVAAASAAAASCYAAASASPTYILLTATTACQLSAVKTQLIAGAADAFLIAQNTALAAANLAQNIAYGAYINAALAVNSANIASAQAGVLSYTASIASQVAANAAVGNSIIANNNAGIAVGNSGNAMNIANQRAIQSANSCSQAQYNVALQTQAKNVACKSLPSKASVKAKAQKLIQCNAAKVKLNIAGPAWISACAQ